MQNDADPDTTFIQTPASSILVQFDNSSHLCTSSARSKGILSPLLDLHLHLMTVSGSLLLVSDLHDMS